MTLRRGLKSFFRGILNVLSNNKGGEPKKVEINKRLANNLHRLAKKGKDRKERKSIKIKLYDLRGQVIGSLGQGESVDYNELLLNKKAGEK
ncbi:hypothetical protein ES695_02895 [Candidatus Atribacteria bacterium 1244-E10-H5-B2]|nr:MAG: hypothetical protein ES695_02895 [Candidatus Atribacteria bacterium 1244-E10-H5-B2]